MSRLASQRVALGVIAGMLLACALGSVFLTVLLRDHGIYTRFQRVDDLGAVDPTYPPVDPKFATRFPGDDPVTILRQVMATVPAVAPDPATEDPLALLEHAEAGGGLVCTGMAGLYRAALEANGFDARLVVLARFLSDPYETHVTVEVREQGRWVIYDPTFGVTFEADGRRLGAQDIKRALVAGGIEKVSPVFVGPADGYPARIDQYYMNWHPLFSNVIVRAPAHSALAKLPIVRWWLGERRYFEVVELHRGENVAFINALAFLTIVVLPGVSLVLAAGAAVLGVRIRRMRGVAENA